MKKENLKVTESSLERLIHISLFTYLFFLIFPHTTTLREIAFWIATLCWIWLEIKTHRPLLIINKITIPLLLFVSISFVSSIIGVETLENLKRFKGEIAVPLILFLIISSGYKDKDKALSLLLAPAIAFAIYTLYVLISFAVNYDIMTFFNERLREIEIFSNYPQRSITIFPITIGIFLCIRSRYKYFLLGAALLEFFILVAYDSFTPLLSAVSVLVLGVLFAQPKTFRNGMRIVIMGFVVLFSMVILLKSDLPSFKHHKERLNKIMHLHEELKTEEGFTDRIFLWKAAIDIIKEKLLLGYGSGMKKYQHIINDVFLNKWKIERPKLYTFYQNFKDIYYPPHNLFLEIAFQSGILGLLAFLAFICLYSFQLVRMAIRSKDFNFFLILIGGTMLSFMIMGLMNNELGNMSGKIFFVVLGAGMGWIKDKESKYSTHSFVR